MPSVYHQERQLITLKSPISLQIKRLAPSAPPMVRAVSVLRVSCDKPESLDVTIEAVQFAPSEDLMELTPDFGGFIKVSLTAQNILSRQTLESK